jgi:hypothetical protein
MLREKIDAKDKLKQENDKLKYGLRKISSILNQDND